MTPRGTEWISFVDAKDETWIFDLAYFRSNWNCIYGSGCAGIEETADVEGQRGCCSYGAHFADGADLARVMKTAEALPSDLWELHGFRPDDANGDLAVLTEALTELDEDGERTTLVVEGACVFQNRPGFVNGAGCAFHLAAVATGIDPLEWKPEVCWQLPIRVEHHVDDNGAHTHMVRQWERRDWGEAGNDLAWWCSEAPEAFTGSQSVAHYLRAEVAALAGESVAAALVDHADRTAGAVSVQLSSRAGQSDSASSETSASSDAVSSAESSGSTLDSHS